MTGRDRQSPPTPRPDAPKVEVQPQRVLAVAIAPDLVMALPRNVLQPGSEIGGVSLDDLPRHPLSGPTAPVLVLSPLVTPSFDAVDLAQMLSENGYRGRYLALTDRLPNPALIRREVAAQAPAINFDVVILDGSSPLHSL